MTISPRIRAAVAADIPDILELYKQPDIDDGLALPVEEATKIFNKMHQYPSYTLFVCHVKAQLAGSFALLIMDNLGHLGAPSAIIEDVVVAPHYQSRGIGWQMMEHAAQLAGEAGCYKITLSADLKRKKAHLFYENLGFSKHGYSYRLSLK